MELKTGNHQTGIQIQKPSNSTWRFPSRPCMLPLVPTKITALSVLPHLHPYSTISLLSACLISPNPLLLWFIKAFITFHIKRTMSISPPFAVLPIYGREFAQFPILYCSFLIVTLAYHYWGFFCPPSGSEAQRTKHWRDKGHQLHPLLLIHFVILLYLHRSFSLHSTLGNIAACQTRQYVRPSQNR